ncbi:MAG TPA: hypothetical protein VNJ10_05945 [Sphingomonas sp.]|nr:hypothetical protein [Sphingomonas sp.]
MNQPGASLTFGQRQGLEAMPSQLALGTLSPQLKALLWDAIHKSFMDHVKNKTHSTIKYLLSPWTTLVREYWVRRLFRNVDEVGDWRWSFQVVKTIMTSDSHLTVFNFVQFLLERDDIPNGLSGAIQIALHESRAAYRVIDRLMVPVASDEQAHAVQIALATVATSPAKGAATHLRNAAGYLTQGRWSDSVRESISAVEGIAKSIEPTADTLGPALAKLKTSISLNPTLASAFGKLYGYSSDEKGIRHALVFDGQPNVTERDALFMFGSCASFVAFLVSASSGK